jgi:hypothetical protein
MLQAFSEHTSVLIEFCGNPGECIVMIQHSCDRQHDTTTLNFHFDGGGWRETHFHKFEKEKKERGGSCPLFKKL